MIDENNVILCLRNTLLDAELVYEIVSGELIAIRAGAFDAGKHTRPKTNATPVVDECDLAVNEQPFDPNDKVRYVDEVYLPVLEVPAANTIDGLVGIMQYSVYVPIYGDNGYDAKALRNMSKWIREVFDPELPVLSTADYHNINLVLDSATPAPAIKGAAWVQLPISVNFRVYNDNNP